MKPRTALILGATGLVGSELLRVLAAAPEYERVTALVRRPLTEVGAKVQQQVVDFDDLQRWQALFHVDDVYCCLGTTMKQAGSKERFRAVDYGYPLRAGHLAQQEGARQFLIVTAMGADPQSAIFYNRVKGEVEQALAGLGLPSLQIVRPSLLLGDRPEVRRGEQAAARLAPLLAPLMVGGLRKYRAISGAAVARAMVRIALRGESGVRIYGSDQLADIAGQ